MTFAIIMCVVITANIVQVEMVRKNKSSLLIGYISPYNPIPPYGVIGIEATVGFVLMAVEDYNRTLDQDDIR